VPFCPAYPRAMDQAFFCLEVENGGVKLKLDQNASLHNPLRVTVPSKNLTFTRFTRRSHSGGGKTQHRRRPPQPLAAEAAAAYLASLSQHSNFFHNMKKRFLLCFFALCCGLLWLLPGCKKDPLDGKTTVSGRVTEYGTQAPVAGATLYLMCYEGTFGGGGTSTLMDSVRTDADGRYSISFTDCGSAYLIPYKKGYLQHIDVDLGGSKTVDIVMDPEAWLKIQCVPDLNATSIHFQVENFSKDVHQSVGEVTYHYLDGVPLYGGRTSKIYWTTYPLKEKFQDDIFLVPHDTTLYTIHY
jgi:hypothetical protein